MQCVATDRRYGLLRALRERGVGMYDFDIVWDQVLTVSVWG